jgi:putative FmdB family regulatory protein
MPLYEYECFLCGHRFERIQRVNDGSSTNCPECGGAVRRLLGVPALQFKGSGFYITDYGKGTGGRPGEKPAQKEPTETSPTATKEPATKDPVKKETATASSGSSNGANSS